MSTSVLDKPTTDDTTDLDEIIHEVCHCMSFPWVTIPRTLCGEEAEATDIANVDITCVECLYLVDEPCSKCGCIRK